MPQIYANKHHAFMQEHFKSGRMTVINKPRQVFAQDHGGYCFLVNILVKHMPHLEDGVQYAGMLQPRMSDYNYILTDDFGNIDSMSYGMAQMLSLTKEQIKYVKRLNIQILVPQFLTMFQKFKEATDWSVILDNAQAQSLKVGEKITFIAPQHMNSLLNEQMTQQQKSSKQK